MKATPQHDISFVKGDVEPQLQGSGYSETREVVSLQDQTSPCFEMKEKFKCIEYIGNNAKWTQRNR